MKLEIELANEIDLQEFRKTVCFISPNIQKFSFQDNKLIIECSEQTDLDALKDDIINISSKYKRKSQKKEILYEKKSDWTYQKDVLHNPELFYIFSDGTISLRGKAMFLYEYFNQSFERLVLELGAIRKQYPVLLPMSAYKKTGYLKHSPQYAMFCCSACEDIHRLENLEDKMEEEDWKDYVNQPVYALSPSACFHTYLEYENQTLPGDMTVTFLQSVFRNEGRLNYDEIGRLRDYHVRETVFLGSQEYVSESRMKLLDQVTEFLKQIGVEGKIEAASDPFILPKMQKYKKIQLMEASKYEIQLNVNETKLISVASFNIHGTAFTHPFHIEIKDHNDPVTGCVGFGIERFVIAFLSQYGDQTDTWPEMISNGWKEYKKKYQSNDMQ